jgi:cytochrome c oxidase assembly factor 4
MPQQAQPITNENNSDTRKDTANKTGDASSTKNTNTLEQVSDDYEDPYDTRLKNSGCFSEHTMLQDCHYNNRDFRMCIKEMQLLKECWKKNNKHQSQDHL